MITRVTVGDLLEFIKENDIPLDTTVEVQDFDNMQWHENIVLAFAEGHMSVSFGEDYEDTYEDEDYESL